MLRYRSARGKSLGKPRKSCARPRRRDLQIARIRLGNTLTETAGSNVNTFSYDALYRLTSADYPGTPNDESWTYDKVGNRKTHTRGGSTNHYIVDADNRLTEIRQGSVSGTLLTAYVYDANGNVTKKCSGGTVTRSATDCTGTTTRSLTWDAQDRLTQVTGSVPTANTYSYDPLNHRIGKTDSKGVLSHYLEGEHLEAIYSGTTLKAKYLRGALIDELVNGFAYDAAGKWTNLTYHHDRLTSVVGISGHNGDTLQTLTYGAFGNVLANNLNGTFPANYQKYTGREEDPDTGFYYYRARYYDMDAGRFLSEDPLGFEAGINFYAYVDNNPVNANDPSGLAGVTKGIVGAGIEILSAFRTVGHHTVPREVLKVLPSEVANNPLVRGAKGAPNIWQIPENLHKSIHQGAGGGAYNEAFKTRVAQYGDNITAENVAGIRNDLAKQFGIDKYAPSAGGSILREAGSVIAGVGLGVLGLIDAIEPTQYLMSPSNPPAGATPGRWWCFGCYQMPQQSTPSVGPHSSGAAGGGFLLYPNKANTNMMQSVYSK